MASSIFIALLSLSIIAVSHPLSSWNEKRQASPDSTCARIASAIIQVPNNPGGGSIGTVDAELAWECIQSVPFNRSAAVALVESLKPYLEFQTTIDMLADPPDIYEAELQDPVDIRKGLYVIGTKALLGAYGGEYEFGFDLYTLFQSAHDGHLSFYPDVVSKIFSWARPVPLVSVSQFGSEEPAVFVYEDVLAAATNSSFQPSPVNQINGDDTEDFLQQWSQIGSLQDRDALWNNLFYDLSQVGLGSDGTGTGAFSGGGRGRMVYPGPITTLTFDNGTTRTWRNYARVLQSFDGIKSGQDLYNKYFTVYVDPYVNLLNQSGQPNQDPRIRPYMAPERKGATPIPGYPAPVVRHSENFIGGYYLEGKGYSDVAVLSVPSFVGDDSQPEFQSVAKRFLAQAKSAGKKKLIVDLSSNGGGTIMLGYDLFKQLMPQLDPYGGNRFRAHPTLFGVGDVFSDVAGKYPRSLSIQDDVLIDMISSPWNYRSDTDVNGQPFPTWHDKFGPHEFGDEYYTSTQRWRLDDQFMSLYSGNITITGYGNDGGKSLVQPFAPEDIVIVYNGYCASTCTIFSEMMRQQGKVSTIAMGGRPSKYGLIQAVGGTKGTNNWSWLLILQSITEAFGYASPAQKEALAEGPAMKFDSLLPLFRGVGFPNLNMRDGVRQGDPSGVALQFIVEPADCRLYYTADMTVDITAMWKAAADTKWAGKECVAGSLGGGDSGKVSGKAPKTQTTSVHKLASDAVSALRDSLSISTRPRLYKADGIMFP